jgi:DNA repair protein RecO (recombination protein O)
VDAIENAGHEALLPLVVAFLVKGIAMHGYRPQFSACVICGGVAEGATAFSLESAGPVCPACRTHAPDTVLVSADAQALLSALLRARMAEVAGLDIAQPVLMEAFALARRLVVYHVPARLKALDLYGASLGAR